MSGNPSRNGEAKVERVGGLPHRSEGVGLRECFRHRGMKRLLLCRGLSVTIVTIGVQLVTSAAAQSVTNYWTGAADGLWEDLSWSLGERPSINESAVAITSAGNKAVTIGRDTALGYPETLSIQYLEVGGPDDSTNALLLRMAGLEIPLRVRYDLTVGRNGAFASVDSALAVSKFAASGPCMIMGGTSSVSSVLLGLEAPAYLKLSQTLLSGSRFILGPQDSIDGQETPFSSTVEQFGGTNALASALYINGDSTYRLHAGIFRAGSLYLQAYGNGPGLSRFVVSEGYADVGGILLGLPSSTPNGEILLESGQFRASRIHTMGGRFTQTGGTNISHELRFPSIDQGGANYTLSGGTLVSSNLTLGYSMEGQGTFVQSGGAHSNRSMDLRGHTRQGATSPLGMYEMTGGLLVCDKMNFVGGTFSQSEGVSHVTNAVLWATGPWDIGSMRVSGGSFYGRTNSGVAVSQTGGLYMLSEGLRVLKHYLLYGGTLVAPHIFVEYGTLLLQGNVTNTGSLKLNDSARLRVTGAQNVGILDLRGSATLDLQDEGATVWFAGAAAWPAYGRLIIQNWNGSRNGGGVDRVLFGNDASTLSASQTDQIAFENPPGFPTGVYPAKILASGEVVPDRPSIAVTRAAGSMTLSWRGSAMLYWSTNVAGPFVPVTPGPTNLYEAASSEAQRFFLLKPGS